jgi:outer membrane protein OmpA-like peptidoglycan-associated protein
MVVADHENHKLESAVAWAASNPDGLLVVGGHAEHSDQPSADLKLSLRRAQAVRDALIRAGAEPDQIVIAAYGSGATSHADPAEDRRVTIWSTREGLYDAVSGVRDADIVVVRGEEIHPRGVVADR